MNIFGKTPKKSGDGDLESYQRKILSWTGYLAMTKFEIVQYEPKSGEHYYYVDNSSLLAQVSFYLQTFNTFLKLVYLSHLLINKYDTIAFLDKMALSCYLLIVAQMVILYWIWLPKYPLNEIIYRNWDIEREIFQRLGEPFILKRNMNGQIKATVWIHSLIAYVGSFCFVIQFSGNPKYYLWSYAIIEDSESISLFALFGLHEFVCMFYAWNLMVGANGIVATKAITLAHFINEMSGRVRKLWKQNATTFTNPIKHQNGLHARSYDSITNILFDYNRMALMTEEYNKCLSYKTIFLHVIGYCQFIADCYVVFQILRIPGTGARDIWFFVEDCAASSLLIYRVYNLMSRVDPASREFFYELTCFLRSVRTSERKRLQKIIKSMRIISLKLGPCPVTRATLLNAMDLLSNYYICVAFWS